MGDLPPEPITISMTFTISCVDYAVPILISIKKGRGATLHIQRIFAFYTFSLQITWKLHLELATDMSSENFLLALKRFIARRGNPDHIYCDNGSNFVGGWNELKMSLNFISFLLMHHILGEYGKLLLNESFIVLRTFIYAMSNRGDPQLSSYNPFIIFTFRSFIGPLSHRTANHCFA